jgi:signal transduction histidine kinase
MSFAMSQMSSINVSLTSSLIPKDYTLFDIHDMMFNLTKDYSRLFTVRTVDLKFKSTIVKPLIVLALRDNLEYAVENLLSNANKFVHDGGSVTVSLSFKNIDTNKVIISITVADNGKGLTPIDIESMWKDNYKGPVDSIGSGLGLAGVASFSRGEGGDVLAKNNSTDNQEKYKTKRSLKNVQSLILGFSWFARRPPRIKKNTKLKEVSKTYKV